MVEKRDPADETAAGIAGAATLIALGNVTSRVLGLVRETVIAYLFGATGLVSAFDVASRVPRMMFDLLIDGLVSSALVPVFSELWERDRATFWQVASIMLSLTAVVMGCAALLLEVFAPQIAWLMSGGFSDELLGQTVHLMRITSPAVIFLSLSGITTGMLYALKRFTLPAFTGAVFNLSMVVVTLALTKIWGWGIESLAVAMLVGSAMQVALQLPGLRGSNLHFNLNWNHPDLRRILRLYAPVVLGLVISQIGIIIDRNLASRTGEQSIAWMRYATTLVQFPLGLVSAAIAMATLPTLSRLASASLPGTAGGRNRLTWTSLLHRPQTELDNTELEKFMTTLVSSLKMVLILIIPAVLALFILAKPVVALIFQHGDFTPADTEQTALALRLYLLGTTFAAIDLPLVFAFYARQNTLTPALVGVLGVGIYLIAALLPTFFHQLRMTDLVLANSIQLASHALIMLWLTNRAGSLRNRGFASTILRILGASLAMAAVVTVSAGWLATKFPNPEFVHYIAIVGLAGIAGMLTYAVLIWLFRVEEINLLISILRRRIAK